MEICKEFSSIENECMRQNQKKKTDIKKYFQNASIITALSLVSIPENKLEYGKLKKVDIEFSGKKEFKKTKMFDMNNVQQYE